MRSAGVFPRAAAALLALALLAAAIFPAPAGAQDPPPPPRSLSLPALMWQQRLAEVDRLIALGNASRAASLLQQLEREAAPRRELIPRLLALAQLREDHEEAERLCREGLSLQADNPRLLRELARALIALERPQAAAAVLDSFVAVLPEARSGLMIAADLWLQAQRPAEALALCDAARQRRGDPRLLARQRAQALLALGRVEEAADELAAEARANPINAPVLRAEVLGGVVGAEQARRLARRLERHSVAEGVPLAAVALLAASLHLRAGDAAAAGAAVAPLLEDRGATLGVLQLAATLAQEAPLIEAPEARAATNLFLRETLARLAVPGAVAPAQRPRVLELLAAASEDALVSGLLGRDPEQAVRELERLLALVREGHPTTPHLYAAQIRLARYTRDVLRRPAEAAAILERLLADLDLPLEGVALARLTLGECHLAAGDSARGRLVLTALAHSSQDRAAAGGAHFALARLDLAGGHWETARDRLATIAMDNPMADYANDALELALAIAEELENPAGGPALLALYARAPLHEMAAQPDSQLAALERFVAAAAAAAVPGQPAHLLERGRWELAQLYRRAGRVDDALDACDRLVSDHPAGRHPADALALRARLLAEVGRHDLARQTLERLLLQYPDHLFADDVRDRLRNLP